MNADKTKEELASELICVHPRSSAAPTLPVPRAAITTRPATSADIPFIDGLQKQHSKALGFFPRAQMEGYVANGWILIAEDAATRTPLGYCASRDRYLKRDELGVIYQLCVTPGHQRGLIGASLIKAVFDRSAYGCKLYCCWCAQDLAANHFWESLGFVPIAFRAGSTGKRRVHIFWQRRINADDTGERATPYWYPSATNGGAIRADRLVFPIPPGTHWTEVEPVALPQREKRELEGVRESNPRVPKVMQPNDAPTARPRAVRFAPAAPPPAAAKPKRRAEGPKAKIDPQLVSKARELRDRYLERVNTDPHTLRAKAKYAISRSSGGDVAPVALLPAA